MGGAKQPSQQTQVSKVELPPWVSAASEENYNMAKRIADRQQYSNYNPNSRYVNPSAETRYADKYYREGMNAADPIYAEALEGFRGLSTYDPTDISGTSYQADTIGDRIKAGDLSTYLNPYLGNVESSALGAVERQRQQALQGNASAATKSKAFGGTRSAITDALTNTESARVAGDLSNQIRAQGYQAATGLLGQDVGTTNQAKLFRAQMEQEANKTNQWADIQGANVRAGAFDDIQAAAKDKEASHMQRYGTLLSQGMRADQLRQQRANFKYDMWRERKGEALNDLNIRLSALGMSPYGKTQTTTTTGTSESSGTDWATTGLGLFKALPGIFSMFSDREAKTDIEKLGKDPETGIPLYAYRYKKDPKTYPKVVGPMAQDIEKMVPGSTKRIGGKLTIDLIKAAMGDWN
jgi:hypothetical protein